MNILWKIRFEGLQAKRESRSLKLMFTHFLLVFSSFFFIIKETYNSPVCNKQLPDFFLPKQGGNKT